MARNPRSFVAFFLIFNILLAIFSPNVVAGRDIPTDSKNTDKKQPEWFIEHDGSVLIPGFGRVIVPKFHKGKHFNPFTYNPGTGIGTSGGSGTGSGIGSTGGGSTGGGSGNNYVPGGDDTFVPNPGVEVPIPGSGGGVPAEARP